MKMFKIYTVGKMKGLPIAEQISWRMQIEELIRSMTQERIVFIHPPLYYNYEVKSHNEEKEIKDWEIAQIRDSDILIVNLDGINDSIGSHFEISAADMVNISGDKHIYIIGVGGDKEQIHPWIELSLHRREISFEKAAEYICEYLLI